MPRFNYNNLQLTAENLIQRFGQSAILRKTVDDLESAAYAPGTTQLNETLQVVSETEQVRDESGALIGRQSRTLLATPTTLVPEQGDEIVITRNGQQKTERIASVNPLSPGGTVIFNRIVLEG